MVQLTVWPGVTVCPWRSELRFTVTVSLVVAGAAGMVHAGSWATKPFRLRSPTDGVSPSAFSHL